MNHQYRLGDGCTITHGYAFSGMVESDDPSLPIVVNIGNFKYDGGFRFQSTKVQRPTESYPEKFQLKPGDVLLVMTCQTPGGEILGIPGRIPNDGSQYLHNQRLGKVVVHRPDQLDLRYLYYLFLSKPFNAHLVATATGSKILHTAPSRIESFQWEKPSLEAQNRIASILSAYDDLIENNTKRIKVLEEMARSLYREWFVHYRFPGHEKVKLVDSALGKVPEGWRVTQLDEVATINARSIRRNHEPDVIDYVDISSVAKGTIHGSQRFAFADAPGRARRLVSHGDTIWSMVRPNLKALAYIVEPPASMFVSTGFAVLSPQGIPASFLYLTTTTDEFADYLMGRARGAAYPAVNTEDFEHAPLLVPSRSILKKMDTIIEPMLLPKLISGEIEVDAAGPG